MNEQNVNTQSQGEVEIDLVELFGVLWHHALMLVIAALVLGAAAFCYSKFFLPEEFQSNTTIYMLDRANPDSGATTNSDLQASAALTKDYAQLITSRHVLEQVIENLGLPYGYSELKSSVSVSTPNDARIVTITVTDTNPRMAQKIADEIRVVGSEHIINVMEIDAVNVIDEANLPTHKSAPSNSRWAMIGALLGLVAAAAVIILRYILDDTVKTQDDVDRYLGLSTLALIPLDENVGDNQKITKNKKKSRRKGEEDDLSEVTASDSYLHTDEIPAERKRGAKRRLAPAPQQGAEEDAAPAAVSEPAETGETAESGDAPRQPDGQAAREARRRVNRPADGEAQRRVPRESRPGEDRRPAPRQDNRRPAPARPAPEAAGDTASAQPAESPKPQSRRSGREMNTEELVRDAVEATGNSLASEIAVMMDEEQRTVNQADLSQVNEEDNFDEDVDLDIIDLD